MRYLIIAALVAAAPAVAASDPVYRDSELTVRLTEKPCDRPILASVLSEVLRTSGEPKRAPFIFQGRDVVTCWTLAGNRVVLADEEGDAGSLALSDFKNDPGI